LIKGVEVEVEAEEVAEDVRVGQKHYEEPGPRGSAADFLLGEEMEGDPSGREEVEAAAIKIHDINKCQCLSSIFYEINRRAVTTRWPPQPPPTHQSPPFSYAAI
jgi:hypothetical protein